MNYIEAIKVLSVRESEVLDLVVSGYTSKEIGIKICLSPNTINKHKNNICQKLGLGGHRSLIKWYRENKIE